MFEVNDQQMEKANIPVRKEIVTELEQIFRIVDDKPYFELKYKKVGEDYYHVGYSSYDFHNVLKWKEEYFELVKENYKETIKKLRYTELPDELVMVDLETRQKAIKALEKQIPKKVLYEDVGFDCYYDANLYACICPSCGLHIIEFSDIDVDPECNRDSLEDMFHSSMVHHTYIGMNNYCKRCGQKLDWGEEDGI